ncbi:MAG: sulfocyanin-like copper-binding protein [Ilumatobacteraceae bacterium]
MKSRVVARAAVVVSVAVLVAGCGSGEVVVDTTVPSAIGVDIGEWYVRPDVETVPSGARVFEVENEGSMMHEFLVVKTDLVPGAIPVSGDGTFDEDLASIEIIDEIPEWGAGSAKTLSVNLTPGRYQLVCNLPGHYSLGMWTGFTVAEL